MSSDVIFSLWRNRLVLLSAFGFVGVGAVVGAGSVYIFYVCNKLQDIFRIQSELSSQIQTSKKETEKGAQNFGDANESLWSFPTQSFYSIVPTSSSVQGDQVLMGVMVGLNKSSKSTSAKKRTSKLSKEEKSKAFVDERQEYGGASSSASGSDSDLECLEKVAFNTDNLDLPDGERVDGWIIDFLKDVDKMLDGDSSSQHEAYIRLQSYKDKLENVCGFWWRFAKATHLEATAAAAVGDKEIKRSLTLSACTRAEKALQLKDNSANAHKWYAITLGSKGDFVSINEKIKNGFIFKEHVDRAVQLNSSDPDLHYLLGRFCLEVSQLGWMERKVASTLFSSPPTATPQEALEHFQASEKLGKPAKDNRLYMAKCYIVLKNNEKAAYWLKQSVEIAIVSSSDKPIHEEAQKLFSKYRQYLK